MALCKNHRIRLQLFKKVFSKQHSSKGKDLAAKLNSVILQSVPEASFGFPKPRISIVGGNVHNAPPTHADSLPLSGGAASVELFYYLLSYGKGVKGT